MRTPDTVTKAEAFAAMCLWEEINERTLLSKAGEWPALNRYRQSTGSNSLREECLAHGPRIEQVWEVMCGDCDTLVDMVCSFGNVIRDLRLTRAEACSMETFDWEFVPAYLTVIGLGEQWQKRAAAMTPHQIAEVLVSLTWVRKFAQGVAR